MTAVPESTVLSVVATGPTSFEVLKRELGGPDPRWLAVTVYRLIGDGRLATLGCDPDHDHDGGCVVEVTR